MCSPSVPQHQNKRDKSNNILLTSSYAPTTIVSASLVPVIINSFVRVIAEVPNDDTMSCYSEVSYDDDDDNDDSKEHDGVDRWSPSSPGCHSIIDPPLPPPPPPPPPQDRPLPLECHPLQDIPRLSSHVLQLEPEETTACRTV
jgi:hypothetical protein